MSYSTTSPFTTPLVSNDSLQSNSSPSSQVLNNSLQNNSLQRNSSPSSQVSRFKFPSPRLIVYMLAIAAAWILVWFSLNKGNTSGYWNGLLTTGCLPSWGPSLMVYWLITGLLLLILTWAHYQTVMAVGCESVRNLLDMGYSLLLVLWVVQSYVWFYQKNIQAAIWIMYAILAVLIFLTFMYWKSSVVAGSGCALVLLWFTFVTIWMNMIQKC
jgi:hypothetical protein